MYYATSLMTILSMYKNGYTISNIHQSYSTILIAAGSLKKTAHGAHNGIKIACDNASLPQKQGQFGQI